VGYTQRTLNTQEALPPARLRDVSSSKQQLAEQAAWELPSNGTSPDFSGITSVVLEGRSKQRR
jgi:hypothetical protein